MATYTQKPKYIEAYQFTEDSNYDFIKTADHPPAPWKYYVDGPCGGVYILQFGDYVITEGDFLLVVCKEDFEKEWIECPI